MRNVDLNALEDRLARAEAFARLLDDHVQECEELEVGHMYMVTLIREDLTACIDLIRSPLPEPAPTGAEK